MLALKINVNSRKSIIYVYDYGNMMWILYLMFIKII